MTRLGRPATFCFKVARMLAVWRVGEDGVLGLVPAELGMWVFCRSYEQMNGRCLGGA